VLAEAPGRRQARYA